MNAKEALHWMENDTGIMSCNDDAWPIAIRALRLLAAVEANDGSTPETEMEVVSLVEDIVTAARLTQFYEDPIYKPWSEQVWRSVDTARRTISMRRKVLERIAAERNALAARVEELEKDAERYRTIRIRPSVVSETLPSSYQRFWWGAELDAAVDAAARKP